MLSCLLLFCPAPVIAETEGRLGQVAKFVDGDTLILDPGEAIRLVGINTPEMARDGRPAEPLALEARDTLVALLADGKPDEAIAVIVEDEALIEPLRAAYDASQKSHVEAGAFAWQAYLQAGQGTKECSNS